MAGISPQDARNLFTKSLAAVYRERISPTSFLRSFFPVVEKGTKEISIEVERGFEKIAVDVVRGTEGNRNEFGKSTEKIFVPPYFREYFDMTSLDGYDKMFGDGEISLNTFDNFLSDVSDKMSMVQSKIERSYEYQCSQVLETGIVTLTNGTNIDFKRKALSKVNVSGSNPWTTGSNSPYDDLNTGAQWLRSNGKSQGGTFNVIMGNEAYAAFEANATVQARSDIRNFMLDAIREPQRNSVGANYHGTTSAGAYRFNIWTYVEEYTNSSGVQTKYMNAKNIVILPESPRFNLVFAAVPQLLTQGGMTAGAYKFGEYTDERKHSHIMDVRSAGLAIPVAVDQIYTAQVVA